MPDESVTSSTRRRYLTTLGTAGGVGSLAGNGGRNDDSTGTPTESVVFTDTETSSSGAAITPTATPATQVFDGGDREAFVTAVEATAANGVDLRIDPGRYRFAPDDTKHHVEFQDLPELTIAGPGATIAFTDPLAGGIRFVNCEPLTVRGLALDYEPVPFTQGEIVAVSRADRTVTVQLDAGYPTLDHEMFAAAATMPATTHGPDGEFVTGVTDFDGLEGPDKFFRSIDWTGDRRYRLTLEDASSFAGLTETNRLTILARNNGTALACYKVAEPTFKNLTVHAANGAAIAMWLCTAPTFRDCAITRPAESDRQLTSNADGIRIQNCRDGGRIENCRRERLGDDSVAIDSRMVTVAGFQSDRTVFVSKTPNFELAEGDVIEAISPSGERSSELGAIEAFEPIFAAPGAWAQPATITFADPVDETIETGDFIANTAIASSDVVVRNNEFRSHRGNLVRANSRGAHIEGNVLDGADGHLIELHSGTGGYWPPKRWAEDVVVRDNDLRGAGLRYIAHDDAAAIRVHHETPPGVPTTAADARHRHRGQPDRRHGVSRHRRRGRRRPLHRGQRPGRA